MLTPTVMVGIVSEYSVELIDDVSKELGPLLIEKMIKTREIDRILVSCRNEIAAITVSKSNKYLYNISFKGEIAETLAGTAGQVIDKLFDHFFHEERFGVNNNNNTNLHRGRQ